MPISKHWHGHCPCQCLEMFEDSLTWQVAPHGGSGGPGGLLALVSLMGLGESGNTNII